MGHLALGGVGNAGSFTPLSISSLQWWLAANVGTYQDTGLTTPATANNTTVKGWADKSISANNATQATTGNAPVIQTGIINGLPALYFLNTSSQAIKGSAFTNAADSEIFFVSKIDNTVTFGNPCPLGTATTGALIRYNSLTSISVFNNGPSQVAIAVMPNQSNPHINNVQINSVGNTVAVWCDGTLQISNSVTPGSFTWGEVGARGAGFADPFKGWVAEVLCFNALLSSTNRTAVKAYLAAKYAITVN